MKSLLAPLLLCAACVAAPPAPPAASPDLSLPASWRVADCPHCPAGLDEALAEEAAGHWDKAEQLYAAAVERDPRCDRALLGFGRSLIALGRPSDAADVLAADVQGRATAPRLVGARACALHAAGRHAEVVAVLAGVDVGGLAPDALVALGRSALIAGEYKTAGIALSRLVQLQPSDGGAWLDLARTLYLLKDDATGLHALRQARALGADLGALQPLAEAAGGA